jgi:hypothetical protein
MYQRIYKKTTTMCLKAKVKKMNGFVSFITFGWAAGITLAPFGIYIKEKYLTLKRMVNHEKIHWQQQLEMLIIFFYLWYFIEWLIKLFFYGNKAYHNLSFEREANEFENDYTYLEKRKHFAWIKRIFK